MIEQISRKRTSIPASSFLLWKMMAASHPHKTNEDISAV
jgi:hypothetical protein